MKRYGILDDRTGEVLSLHFSHAPTAINFTRALGNGYRTITWVGHYGFPAVACVMEKKGDDLILHTVCAYKDTAHMIRAKMAEEHPGKEFVVQTVIYNMESPDEL